MFKRLACAMFCLVLASCSSLSQTLHKPSIDDQAIQQVAEVSIFKFKFIPQVLTIEAGQTVRWINNEKRQYHSVLFEQNGVEESDYLFPNDHFEKKFNQPGEYLYRCGPHPEMLATIIVR